MGDGIVMNDRLATILLTGVLLGGCQRKTPSLPPSAPSLSETLALYAAPMNAMALEGSWQSDCLNGRDDDSYRKTWRIHGHDVVLEWVMYIEDPCEIPGHTVRWVGRWEFGAEETLPQGARAIDFHWSTLTIEPEHDDVVSLFNEMNYCQLQGPWQKGVTRTITQGPCYFPTGTSLLQKDLVAQKDDLLFWGLDAVGPDDLPAERPKGVNPDPYRKTTAHDWQ